MCWDAVYQREKIPKSGIVHTGVPLGGAEVIPGGLVAGVESS